MVRQTVGIRIHTATVREAWVDYNGHMGDFAYGIVFSDATTAYMDRIGIDASYRAMTGATLYTLDSRIGYLRECHVGAMLNIDLLVLDVDHKRIHIFMRMVDADGEDLAFCEQVLMHISRSGEVPKSASFPVLSRNLLEADRSDHMVIDRPAWIGRRIGLSRN